MLLAGIVLAIIIGAALLIGLINMAEKKEKFVINVVGPESTREGLIAPNADSCEKVLEASKNRLRNRN